MSTQCPTGVTPAPVTVPATMPAVPAWPTTVGVCVTRTAYDPGGLAVTTTMATAAGALPDQTDKQTTSAYTDDRLLASSTSPSPTGTTGSTSTTSTRYDAVGRAVSTTDANGNTTVTDYTPDHLAVTVTEPGFMQPNDDGSTTQITHVTTTTYNAAGQTVSVTDPMNQTARTEFTADDLTARSVNTGGGTTSYTYDRAGNTTAVLSPSGNAKDQTNPGGVPATMTYTDDDLPLATYSAPTIDDLDTGHAVLHQVAWTYDAGGLKQTADHNTTELDHTVLVRSGTGGAQKYAYYPDGLLQTETGRGDGYPVSAPASEKISTAYDGNGNATQVTDSTSGGSTTRTGYYLDGSTRTVDDGRGSVTSAAYNGDGQTTQGVQTAPASTPETTKTTYNTAALPTSQTSDKVTPSMTTPWAWTYDPGGRLKSDRTPENQTTTHKYNPDDSQSLQAATRVAGSASTMVSQWTYSYDNLHRQKTSDSKQLLPGDTNTVLSQRQTANYDGPGRLNKNDDGTGSHAATYDADGNRLTYIEPAGPNYPAANVAATYNADDSVKTSTSGTSNDTVQTNVYGPSGVLKSDGCNNYSFDGFDRLNATTLKAGTPCATAAARSESTYAYDGLDRQRADTQTTTTTQVTGGVSSQIIDTATRAMAYKGLDTAVSSETNQNINRTTQYTTDPNGGHAAVTGKDANGTPGTQYLATDGQGNITEITGLRNATGTTTGTSGVACANRLNAWGKPLTRTTTAATDTSTTSSTGTGIGNSPTPCQASPTDGTSTNMADTYYRGERRDNGTGNYQLGTRTYDPNKTAFTSPDTYRNGASTASLDLGRDPLTANRYNYVNGDPVNFQDKTGHAQDPTPSSSHAGDGDINYILYRVTDSAGQSVPFRVGEAYAGNKTHFGLAAVFYDHPDAYREEVMRLVLMTAPRKLDGNDVKNNIQYYTYTQELLKRGTGFFDPPVVASVFYRVVTNTRRRAGGGLTGLTTAYCVLGRDTRGGNIRCPTWVLTEPLTGVRRSGTA